jgi:nitrate/nitrite transporter NarK
MYGYLGGFWALPTSFLTGTAAAASIGLINSLGNLGGFAGPYIVGYISNRTGSFLGGLLYLSASAMVAGLMILCLREAGQKRMRSNGISNDPSNETSNEVSNALLGSE